jgi:hypothetical protein
MSEAGCARPTGASVMQTLDASSESSEQQADQKKEQMMATAKVGKAAPDFGAPAYQKGEFGSVQLSDYVKKGWTLLCFYPGDFTYV